MLKRLLLAVVVLSFCSTSIFAQDEQVFVTFGQGAEVSATQDVFFGDATSGSAYVYSASDFKFDAFDLDFSTSNNDVIQFSRIEVFNSTNSIGRTRFTAGPNDDAFYRDSVNAAGGRLFGASFFATGVRPDLAAAGLDPDFDYEAGFFQLARIDYDIVGAGVADITLALGDLGFADFALTDTTDFAVSPSLGNGTLTVSPSTGASAVGVPEPSAVGLLALGLAGFTARRRRHGN